MGESLLFGLVASCALPLGAAIGGRFQIPKRVLAGMLAFAAGALITALAFELFEDSYEHGGLWRSVVGLLAGAVVFTVISYWLDRFAEGDQGEEDGSEKLDIDAPASDSTPSSASLSGAAGLALLAAVTLDGVPENLALGVSLGEGTGGLALLTAIFVSNLPEALLTMAVVVGAGPLSSASPETLSIPLAFAAGAVLASLADTLMPEAYEQGGPAVALSTAAGFVVSFYLATL
jgi:ZIP family zinc transporter